MKTVPTVVMTVICQMGTMRLGAGGFLTKGWSTLLEGRPNIMTTHPHTPAHSLVRLCVGNFSKEISCPLTTKVDRKKSYVILKTVKANYKCSV